MFLFCSFVVNTRVHNVSAFPYRLDPYARVRLNGSVALGPPLDAKGTTRVQTNLFFLGGIMGSDEGNAEALLQREGDLCDGCVDGLKC